MKTEEMIQLQLYSTEGCHLCEVAEQVLSQTLFPVPVSVEVIDIAESDDMISRYGEKIPVLVCPGIVKSELEWPFNSTGLLFWLEAVIGKLDSVE